MKKIIAFLSALVMTVAMATTVSFAAGNEVVFDTTVDGTTATIEVSVNTTYDDLLSIAMYLDLSDAITKGGTVTVANGCANSNVSYKSANKMVIAAFPPTTDKTPFKSGDVLGTITVTGVSEDFNISLMPTTSRTKTAFESNASGVVTADFGTIGTTVTMVTAPAEPVVTTDTKTYVTTVTDATGCDEIVYTFTTDYAAAPVKEATETVAITAIESAAAVTFGLIVENVVTAVDEVPVSFTVDAIVQ